MVGGCVFLSPVEVVVTDTLDSSTTKTTHFKDSEDEAGDMRELKDRRRNSGPFIPQQQQRKKEEGEETGGERRSHLKAKNTNTKRMTSVLVCKNELIWVSTERCLQAFISSYDSVRMRGSEREVKHGDRETKNRSRLSLSV